MRTIALIVFICFIASINASLSSTNIFRGSRPIIKFCDAHCNEACDRLQVQSDFRMKCENACRWSCDHKRNTHLQPAVMSDAKFFKKVFKKIKGVVKKVGSVVKKVGSVVSKVTSLPGTLITKVVSKLPLPSGLKKVLSVVAPIATGFLTGGAGALSGLKSIGFVNKAITAVKASKIGQIVSKVSDTVKMVKGKIGAVKGLIKGKLTAVGDLVKGKIGNIVSNVNGKIGSIVQKVKDSKIYKTYENVKNKVNEVKNKITGKINGIVGKVVDFKNNALGKLDRFGAVGGFIKGQINDKINEVASGVKAKIQDKINNVKEKIMQKTGIAKVRDFINKGKAKFQEIKGKVIGIGQKYDDFVARI